MNVGWIGLGKLGLPCALVMANSGHQVYGYDVNRHAVVLNKEYAEPGVTELISKCLDRSFFRADSVDQVVQNSDVVFVAVQTPHAPQYGGENPIPKELRDFEYGYLIQAVRDVCVAAESKDRPITLVVVSTVLPGTTNRYLRGLLNNQVELVYSPQFIAMGTVLADFENPEFLLIGTDSPMYAEPVKAVYKTIHNSPAYVTSINNAEMIKVAYNTFISMKLVWANHMSQLCDWAGVDVDAVSNAMCYATDRITSGAYLRAGMGDGGECHPRDLIAMAYLESRANTPGFFRFLSEMRDYHASHLASLAKKWSEQTGLSVVVLGKAYKPSVDLTGGSPALLLASYLNSLNVSFQHWGREAIARTDPAVFVIATNHGEYRTRTFPTGSVVIDPWGDLSPQRGVTLVRPGRQTAPVNIDVVN